MKRNRIVAFLIALSMMLSWIPAYAADINVVVQENDNSIYVEDTQYNPLYEGETLITADSDTDSEGVRLSSTATYKSIDSAGNYVMKKLEARKTSISVNYKFTADHKLSNEEIQQVDRDIFNAAFKYTGVPTEGDYLKWQYVGFESNTGGKVNNNLVYNLVITYTVTYRTTAKQEAQVTTKLNTVMDNMKLDGLSNAEKIRKIYDYICSNVKYDHSSSNEMRYTAYGALIDNLCVCQGYSLLFYRMALEEGINARFIDSANHGWNIVGINGKYYNLDCTWDAGSSDYRYFLKNMADFTGHIRSEEYLTDTFNSAYPMSPYSFDWDKYIDTSIAPNATSISSVTSKSKGFLLKWSKKTYLTDGYIIEYSTKSDFSGAKNLVISNSETKSAKVSGLLSKKKYYVRICTFKSIDGNRYSSAWSDRTYITTKK